MQLRDKTLVYKASQPGNVAYEYTFYTRPTGLDKMRIQMQEIKDDILDGGLRSFSTDNGKTWSKPQPACAIDELPHGTLRRIELAGFVDTHNGLLVNLILEGLLQKDEALDGMSSYYLKYKVSGDGGRTTLQEDHVIQHGPGYNAAHPIEHVYVGKNALMNGAENSILRAPKGHLVVATTITPLAADGSLFNPGGGYTYHDVVILFGHWRKDARIEWELGPRLSIDPSLSTRGVLEPTLALMPDGRILMVMRGSNGGVNDPNYEIPGCKWFSVSSDGGHSWSTIKPWQFTNGKPFFSPSSVSQLTRHSSGKYFWFGNLCRENPKGNGPRHPLVAVEVDSQSLLPIEETVFVVQGFDPSGPASQHFSNFLAYEDRATHDLILHMTPFLETDGVPSGDACVYRLKVD